MKNILGFKYKTRLGQIDIKTFAHLVLGFLVLLFVANYFIVHVAESYWGGLEPKHIGLIAACTAGALIELYQKIFRGAKFDFLDWAVTTLGGYIAMLIFF